MKIGTQLPAMMPLWAPRWTPRQVAEAAIAVGRAADRLGYEWVSVPEHQILPPRARVYKGPWYDPLMTLSYVAAATERVRLFTSILVAPYHEPVVLAKAANSGTLSPSTVLSAQYTSLRGAKRRSNPSFPA